MDSGYCLMDLGPLQEFMARVEVLRQRFEDRIYRFRPLYEVSDDPFWVFEEEDDETLFGGILQVEKGQVYAISQDVYDFVSMALAR